MFFPKKWKFEDILYFLQSKKYKNNEIFEIVENFDSFNDFLNNQNEMFNFQSTYIDEIRQFSHLQIDKMNNYKAQLISFWDERYPKLLKDISAPPIFLFVLGNLQPSDALSISVVGTRKATIYGYENTKKFVEVFVQNGIIITSGLAAGIDTAAHRTAIENSGITYAVIAAGLDKVSSVDRKKIDAILNSNGAIITEHYFGVTARPSYFPQRNRIISGISKALLVVESAIKGGSMITARFAFDQNRDIYAIPNNIYADKSKGCNYLIYKNMAAAALTPEQILEDLGIKFSKPKDKPIIEIKNEDEKKIFELLNHEPIHIDKIATDLNMNITDVLIKLLNLEFKGLIKQLPGKYFIKKF